MTGDRLPFASVEINKIICCLNPGGKVCVAGGHMISHNKGLSQSILIDIMALYIAILG